MREALRVKPVGMARVLIGCWQETRGNMLSNSQPTTTGTRAKNGTLVSYRGYLASSRQMNYREADPGQFTVLSLSNWSHEFLFGYFSVFSRSMCQYL